MSKSGTVKTWNDEKGFGFIGREPWEILADSLFTAVEDIFFSAICDANWRDMICGGVFCVFLTLVVCGHGYQNDSPIYKDQT